MKRNYTITQIIISINVAIFLTAMITNQTNLYILRLGLNSPYNISFLSYITAAFMHASIFHIGFNMIFLYMVGPVFENFLGKQRYLLYYLFTAIVSGFLTSLFSTTITVGASGVLYAMITTLIIIDKFGRGKIMVSNGRGLVTLLVVNLVLSVTLPNISFIGHIAGIVAGIIAGIAILTLEEKGKLV